MIPPPLSIDNGQKPKLTSTFNDKPSAYIQNNTRKILADNLSALHKAREAFINTKNLERIHHVLKGCVCYIFASLLCMSKR